VLAVALGHGDDRIEAGQEIALVAVHFGRLVSPDRSAKRIARGFGVPAEDLGFDVVRKEHARARIRRARKDRGMRKVHHHDVGALPKLVLDRAAARPGIVRGHRHRQARHQVTHPRPSK
jgi:hypothetical protein